jgi:hypothetical protein
VVAQAPVANGFTDWLTFANASKLADGHGAVDTATPPERHGAVSGQVETALLRLPPHRTG